MMAEAPVMDNEVFNHYLTSMTPAEIAEHLKDSCPEFGDLNVEELLLVQESAFQFIQNKNQNKDTASSYGETTDDSLVLEHENELSHGGSIEHQLALDEALARALELGDDFNCLSVNEDAVSAVDNTRSTVRATPSRVGSQNTRQDDIDPDTMTYEELQSLGESVGSESRGLTEDFISRLPTFRYKSNKSGLFSKKKKETEECVICCDGYKHGAKVITLPCAHHYHSNCITTWLQQNKQCPICQKEVQDN
ncbi:E3 ubiquitin ligase BIG BROTHER-related-like isoform X2 [Salvia miltiorrhiza]|uniref:E3 ubiquitin ligase BIG BROTHER-related-like isoform X2 n=1 Tax=Salvia miltiorrhiza TaxID=226208 RepID=UPI0025AB6302|nr:E3 ubiquitin ligase BIG BROTHER-related-like isoform X2 [Salvia miltiorrhiza]XP_057774416.1 E3 ubiquitin ligase BIG BROTHER-related-like isoform X2 [Salvia miltiorrhiza]XP_057774417.1 E3 ubiquitin ligase BIG BROTHER-related-like isoform X2 [Salvia miltiorrhiza]XP_057774418.1 E3 ubiquitin ligase BIG BROTHER-related-like isoform X2 [Salvia miltiorrhiza]XP_057774419.1 E3 ubiquitin ligase BIG BROTHER-related-like isoform X2 [Salvia miltiorrhiza]XP_057774420.1 E3 ubiquitin ligase BIG BROTHER-rel